MSHPVYCRRAALDAFRAHLPEIDTTAGLFRTACAISLHEMPEASVEETERVLDRLAAAVLQRVRSDSPQARFAHLHDVLFDLIGLRGDAADYYNPANSYLPEVLRRRRGLPITLVLVYKCVAERVGLDVRGINAPGHFLAGVCCDWESDGSGTGERMTYLDPFHGGKLLTAHEAQRRVALSAGISHALPEEVLAPATHRQWVARMLNNLQAVFYATGRERDLWAMQELQALL